MPAWSPRPRCPSQRHAWVIEVEPEVDPGPSTRRPPRRPPRRPRPTQALADLQGGKAWDEVAKTVSTDASTAPQAGDLGWLQKDDTQADEGFIEAVFAAAAEAPTAVIEGDDGIYRIGRATEIAPETVDSVYQDKIVDRKIDLAKYRTVVAGDVIHQKLDDKIVADATEAGTAAPGQRDLHPGSADRTADGRREDPPHPVRTQGRPVRGVGRRDPRRTTRPGRPPKPRPARRTRSSRPIPTLFDSIARSESDEESARGVTGTGGKLPYFDSSMTGVDKDFLAAITKPGLQPGQLLEPIKSAFGWHIIQIMYRPTDDAWLKGLKTKADGGADFATLARDNSEAETAGHGGDLGWVAKGQLHAAADRRHLRHVDRQDQ